MGGGWGDWAGGRWGRHQNNREYHIKGIRGENVTISMLIAQKDTDIDKIGKRGGVGGCGAGGRNRGTPKRISETVYILN